MTALDSTRASRVVGYGVKSGNFNNNASYLPQRIALLGEANDANQSSIDTTPFEFVNSKEVGDKYGYGSPLHQMARIARPVTGNILGGIPTIIYPQLADAGAIATIKKLGVTVATSVTSNVTHNLIVNGRTSLDGTSYAINLVIGDDAATVKGKIVDAINNVLGAPCTAAINVDDIDFTTKWKGATSTDLSIEVDTNDNAAGVVYAELVGTDGAGSVDALTSLGLFGSEWNTLVVNPYGESEFVNLEAFNGTISASAATGRYAPSVFMPFMAVAGSKLSAYADLLAITDADARKDQITNFIAPAPNSKGWDWEAAVNMVALWSVAAQNKPHTSIGGQSYRDMPVPSDSDIGDMADYDYRDILIKGGCSTVQLKNGKYTVEDLVTTYHPDGETPPKFRYVRDINIDWNYGYNWKIIVDRSVQGKAILKDGEVSRVGNTIALSMVKQLAAGHNNNMGALAFITDLDFANENISVEIGTTNPARLNVNLKYKRTSTAEVVDTLSEVGFFYNS